MYTLPHATNSGQKFINIWRMIEERWMMVCNMKDIGLDHGVVLWEFGVCGANGEIGVCNQCGEWVQWMGLGCDFAKSCALFQRTIMRLCVYEFETHICPCRFVIWNIFMLLRFRGNLERPRCNYVACLEAMHHKLNLLGYATTNYRNKKLNLPPYVWLALHSCDKPLVYL